MPTGAITSTIDVAQVTLYVFFAFFAALVWYLRREDKREGYPLLNDRSDRVLVQGYPTIPDPKTFILREGHSYQAPPGNPADPQPINAVPDAPWPGAPMRPVGDPMRGAVGPASYAARDERPELTAEGEAMIVPIRVANDFYVEPNDPDPRGMPVIAADGLVAGTVRDLWIDRSEPQIRYLEVALPEGGRTVLFPMNLARIDRDARQVTVRAVLAEQFAGAPDLANPTEITLREEDRIMAYFGSGHLFATPERSEPLV